MRPILDTISSHPIVNLRNIILCMDSNTQNKLWDSPRTDDDGRIVEEFIIENGLNLINTPIKNLLFKPKGTTFVYITLMGSVASAKVSSWKFLSTPSMSDHLYIYFTLDLQPKHLNLTTTKTKHRYREYVI